MLRTRLAKAYIKRTIRPLYGWTQTTPKSCFLDPAWNRSVDIYPGMIFVKTAGENVTLAGAGTQATKASQVPYGFGALYVGGDGIDEVLDSGINAFAVWVPGPDAEFEILAPAYDNSQITTEAGDGTETLLYASTGGTNQGKLVLSTDPNATSQPVCRLLKVNSATKITVGGIR